MHIDSYSFGSIRIDGRDYSGDVILLGGDVRGSWWREAGGHVYAAEDFAELLAAAPEVVVLGTGYFGRVKVLEETLTGFADGRILQPACLRGPRRRRCTASDVLIILNSQFSFLNFHPPSSRSLGGGGREFKIKN